MPLQINKTVMQSGVPVFQTVLENAQGGFTLDITGLAAGSVVKAGSVMGYDESTRMAKLIKTATVYENAGSSATAYKVYKGHYFAVGDFVALTVGGAADDITAIDKTNAAYDTITLAATIGAATAGASFFQSSAQGSTAGALPVTPKGLLYDDVDVATGADAAVCIRGTVYARRTPGVPTDIRTKLPLFVFSESF